MNGWVIFATRADFDTAHAQAKALSGLPKTAEILGVEAPEAQKTVAITGCIDHPTDGTVLAYINGGWDESLKEGFEFLTLEQVHEYFPEL